VSHFLLMVAYALLTGAFFALLWRHEASERRKLFLKIVLWMVGGGLLLAWIMYPFPSSPPVPFP